MLFRSDRIGQPYVSIPKETFDDYLSGRVYLTAQNVFTITKYKGLDPEIDGGYDSVIYPRPFVGILGVNLNF